MIGYPPSAFTYDPSLSTTTTEDPSLDPILEAARAAIPADLQHGSSLSTLPIEAQNVILSFLPITARSRMPEICCEFPDCGWFSDEEDRVKAWLDHCKQNQ